MPLCTPIGSRSQMRRSLYSSASLFACLFSTLAQTPPMPVLNPTPKRRERPFDGIDILRRVERSEPTIPRTLIWHIRRRRAHLEGSPREYIVRIEAGDKPEFLFISTMIPSKATT